MSVYFIIQRVNQSAASELGSPAIVISVKHQLDFVAPADAS